MARKSKTDEAPAVEFVDAALPEFSIMATADLGRAPGRVRKDTIKTNPYSLAFGQVWEANQSGEELELTIPVRGAQVTAVVGMLRNAAQVHGLGAAVAVQNQETEEFLDTATQKTLKDADGNGAYLVRATPKAKRARTVKEEAELPAF